MSPIHHVFITRFNLASPGRDRRKRLAEGWLEHRIGLFETLCLPSVLSQGSANFQWLLYCDADTPAAARRRLCGLTAGDGRIHWKFGSLEDFSLEAIRRHVAGLAHPSARWQLTTQLDNDDSLPSDFVEVVQAHARPGAFEVLNFPDGYLLHRSRMYHLRHLRNPFSTVSESPDVNRTVMTEAHMVIDRIAPIRQVDPGVPMWVQTVHDRNISNRVRGRLAPFRSQARFPVLADYPIRQPSDFDLMLDARMLQPLRACRDLGIRGAKALRDTVYRARDWLSPQT